MHTDAQFHRALNYSLDRRQPGLTIRNDFCQTACVANVALDYVDAAAVVLQI
jgi:hypothetical protein